MLAFLIFVVFLLGLLCGVILTVLIAVHIDEKDVRAARKEIEKENAEDRRPPTILAY
jgi:uncharacterized membrane protein YciS (DUF1049 family)